MSTSKESRPSSSLLETDEAVAAAVRAVRVVAVLGMKPGDDPGAPAHRVPASLAEHGIRIIPVNPKYASIDGRPCYAAIGDVPDRFDTIDVFRAPRFIPGHAAEILALPAERRPRLVWLQSGIRHDEAAIALAAAGMQVVQDRCLGVDMERFRGRD